MFGIIVISHGKLSEGLVDASNMIFGPQENMLALALNPDDQVEMLKDKIVNAYQKVNADKGVLIMTDLMSASPFNQSTLAINSLPEADQNKTHILTGVNLPMVIEAINQNLMQTDLDTAITTIKDSAKNGIEDWSIKDILVDNDDDDF